MGRDCGDDPQSSRWPAVLVLLPGDAGRELRRPLVRTPGVSGGRDHVRQPRSVAEPRNGAAAGWVVRSVQPSRGAASAAARQSRARGSRVFDVSDSTGSFTLVGLPDGRQLVRILYGDSLAYEQEMDLKRGKTLTLSVLLDVVTAELAPIVVEAQTLRAERSLAGFYDRRK